MQSTVNGKTESIFTLNIKLTEKNDFERWAGLRDGCIVVCEMCRNTKPTEVRPFPHEFEQLALHILSELNKQFI